MCFIHSMFHLNSPNSSQKDAAPQSPLAHPTAPAEALTAAVPPELTGAADGYRVFTASQWGGAWARVAASPPWQMLPSSQLELFFLSVDMAQASRAPGRCRPFPVPSLKVAMQRR